MFSDSSRDRRGASSLTAYDSSCSVTGTVILKRDDLRAVSRGQRVASLPLGFGAVNKRKRTSRRSSSWSLDSTDGLGRTLDWPFDRDTGRRAAWPLPPSHKAGIRTINAAASSASRSQRSVAGPSSSTDLSNEVPTDTPPEKKLKLKVSRGALVKERGQTAGPFSASYNGQGHRYRYPTPRRNGYPSLRNRARPQPTQPRGIQHNPPKTKDLILHDLLTTSPSHSRVNGRALRRLMNRFPDLEKRVVAMSDLDVAYLAARRGGDGGGYNAGGSGYHGGGVGYDDGESAERKSERDWDLRRLRRGARLKGRVFGWVRRAKEVVLGRGEKVGLESKLKLKSKSGLRVRSKPSRWGRRR